MFTLYFTKRDLKEEIDLNLVEHLKKGPMIPNYLFPVFLKCSILKNYLWQIIQDTTSKKKIKPAQFLNAT